jgi:hypothetical protein
VNGPASQAGEDGSLTQGTASWAALGAPTTTTTVADTSGVSDAEATR